MQFLIGQARHDHFSRAQHLAQYPATPPEVLAGLAGSERWWSAVTWRPIPASPWKSCGSLLRTRTRTCGAASQNPGLPVELVLTLARNQLEKMRVVAAAHPAFPCAALTALELDASRLECSAAARHPALPGTATRPSA